MLYLPLFLLMNRLKQTESGNIHSMGDFLASKGSHLQSEHVHQLKVHPSHYFLSISSYMHLTAATQCLINCLYVQYQIQTKCLIEKSIQKFNDELLKLF